MYRVLSALLLCCCAVTLSGRDIDLEKHVKKYWTRWHNRQVEVADGSKRWPLTPELKRERLDHYKSALSKFAPHIVEETYIIDRAFNWKKGTYLGILRFGARNIKIVPDVPKPPHECTSWVTMDNLTGGKEIIIHKNRDSQGRPVAILRRAVPGKHAWIGNGPQYGLSPSQGINDRGVVVMMNAGDALPEAENSQYGFGVFLMCRIMLEEAGTAKEAVELLKKIIYSNSHTHVECGSIWFIGDFRNVYIVEHSNRKVVAKKVNSGFIARANAFHYPEMQIYSLRNYNSLIAHSRREFAVRDYLVNTQWRNNGVITPLDIAASSRINKVDGDPKCYPPCGKSTISASTFTIDKEYPEYLSSMYTVFASPASSCYLPVPMTLKEIPEEILDGSLSMRSFELMDKKLPLLPADKLAVLEKRLYDRHSAAIEKARKLLRTGKSHTVQVDVAKILNDTFAENFKDLQATVAANR